MSDLAQAPCGPVEDTEDGTEVTTSREDAAAGTTEFAKIANQFVVPVVNGAQIEAMVVLSLSVEVPLGETAFVFDMEPKLRDRFMQVLFNHANIGGFSGAFTSNENMRVLRGDLHRAARTVLGDVAHDVLILEMVRQDM
ncbi:MAG: flagellar basal body-associated protein FliL [Paracoccaceae bacterium]